MKHTLVLGVIVLVAFAANSAWADLGNGSFEGGLTPGWTVGGDTTGSGGVQAVTQHGAWGPSDGSRFALLKSDGAKKEYLLSQSFTPSASDILAFDYFWDDRSGNAVSAYGKILNSSANVVSSLIKFSVGDGDTPSAPGWATYQGSIADLGLRPGTTYTLLFGIKNTTGNPHCYLGIDNAHLAPAPVPVPGAVLLGILGLVAAGRRLRQRC